MPVGDRAASSRLHDPQGFTGYELLYGGIDSDGITERTGDISPLMAAVAQSHAAEVSCPVVRREFMFWPEDSRLLFDGITMFDTPVSETSMEFEITAESWETRQSSYLALWLSAGAKSVRLSFTNNATGGEQDAEGNPLDRNLGLDRLLVRDQGGSVVASVQLEALERQRCGRPRGEFYWMTGNCSIDVPFELATDGIYSIEIRAHQQRAGQEGANLLVDVESQGGGSRGEILIRRKLAELHQRLFGVTVAPNSPDVDEAYAVFVEVWNRKRSTEGPSFSNGGFNCTDTGDHLYLEGLVPDIVRYTDSGNSQIDSDRLRAFRQSTDNSDPRHVVRTWVVTLAYLLTDFRYLYF